ncbi:MAG TPA: DUF4012 domain-containing protein [Phototrophicaceae bacterium]|nr:DUF4012 domain-containing protein [Phototrophicaceae bacterium]
MNQPDLTDIATDTSKLPPLVEKPHRRRSRSRWKRLRKRLKRLVNWRILLVTLVSILVVVVVGALVLTTDAANRVNTSVSNLNRVIEMVANRPGTELTLTDFQRLQSSINDLLLNLNRARWQTVFLRPFAFLNPDLNATFLSLSIAEELALAADDVLTGLEPTLFFMVSGDDSERVIAQISSGERIIELLDIGRSRFLSANDHLEKAGMQLAQVDFAEVSPAFLLQTLTLQSYHQQFKTINDLLLTAPDTLSLALGLNDPQSYLILSQNSDELRPSGGYISTYGWMTVRNGRITDYNYRATTAQSPNPPKIESPYPVPEWWIQYGEPVYAAWDGSWYADFSKTAAMASWYYNAGNNPESPVTGVIGLDIVGFEYILNVIGEVVVPEYDVKVTKANFRQVVYDIRAAGQEPQAHKQFVAALYRQIFSDWQTLSRDQAKSTELLGATIQALQEKHLLLYFEDAVLNQAVQRLGWAGIQAAEADHDYLMAADANLGNKSNRSIIRQLTYDVEIEPDGRLQSRATVAYDYPRTLAENDPAVDAEHHGPLDYNNLLQVFVPAASGLTTNEMDEIQAVEADSHTIFVRQVEIPYDGGDRFQFLYETPALVEHFGPYHQYRLLLQKQPGIIAEIVNVQVSLPPNATLVNATPEALATYNLNRSILEFRLTLTTDQWIEIIYRDS